MQGSKRIIFNAVHPFFLLAFSRSERRPFSVTCKPIGLSLRYSGKINGRTKPSRRSHVKPSLDANLSDVKHVKQTSRIKILIITEYPSCLLRRFFSSFCLSSRSWKASALDRTRFCTREADISVSRTVSRDYSARVNHARESEVPHNERLRDDRTPSANEEINGFVTSTRGGWHNSGGSGGAREGGREGGVQKSVSVLRG